MPKSIDGELASTSSLGASATHTPTECINAIYFAYNVPSWNADPRRFLVLHWTIAALRSGVVVASLSHCSAPRIVGVWQFSALRAIRLLLCMNITARSI